MDQVQTVAQRIRPIPEVIDEVRQAVIQTRTAGMESSQNIKDLRWKFDQVSAKMNQAIYNDQSESVHRACLDTIAVLVEILARS